MVTPRCVDLFSGAGGFSLGFHNSGFDILAATDIHEDALKTYAHNFPDIDTVCEDIVDIADDIDLLLEQGDFSVEDVDVVVGGPPCKGFSTAGLMDPDDPRNSLIDSYLEVVDELNPEIVVMENVKGILGLEGGRFADKIQTELEEQGYRTPAPQKVSAANYGVPQFRTRVLFTGSKLEEEVLFPKPRDTFASDGGTQIAETEGDNSMDSVVTAKQALSDLAFLGIGEESDTYQIEPQSAYQREMRAGTEILHNHKSTNHGDTVRERFSKIPKGGSMDDLPEKLQTSKHTQQRLHPAKPSATVTTLPEDIIHYGVPRIPTAREVARLQSFPDWFEFKGPRTTGGPQRKESCPQYSQIGNAVPPKLAEAIATEIYKQFN